MTATTFFWHDYETTGTDARRDRPAQFAGIRTNLALEVIADPVMLYCKPVADVLPQPEACLITGITPQHLEREGVSEPEFAAAVLDELGAPGTCGVGYNSIRFDDEFTRQLLYRNFYDPYEREWKDGNSRWDLIDLARMCFALRPDGIHWPQREDGSVSFRLEDLARANGLKQDRAHDALSDVEALIDLARLIRGCQPRLFDFHFDLRRKQRASQLLDVAHCTPAVHVSSRYPASRGCLAIVAPLAVHPTNANGVIVYDLDVDPSEMLALDADEIADRVFVARADLPEDVERIPLKVVHANRSPALAPMSVLKGVDAKRIALDTDRAMRHLQMLTAHPGLASKVRAVFAAQPAYEPITDPELALYAGFLPDADKRLLRDVRNTSAAKLATTRFAFKDARYSDLLFRYRARNWPDSLSSEEAARWEEFRRHRLTTQTPLTTLTLDDYFVLIQHLRTTATQGQVSILDALDDWGMQLRRSLD